MAMEMHRQFSLQQSPEGKIYQWDPKKMHIFCFCHKLALIVNAGLAELGVKAPPPGKVKSAARGHFPIIGTIEEEDEPEEGDEVQNPNEDDLPEHNTDELEDFAPLAGTEEEALIDDEAEWDRADAEDEETPAVLLEQEVVATHRRQANQLDFILNKVTFHFHFTNND